ncbi:hypothetical protein [Halorussus amylolyticus]|uniref:hypothetical protein n=1 Tax=Halorussus amylolyticus TaxID=1126242 RepID=UPI00104E627F|nr:hypothetical protein [Halorussus amylolyticus]
MELLGYVESATFFLNKGGNPRDYQHALGRLHTATTSDLYTDSSPEFTYYMDRISEDMLISTGSSFGPDPLEQLPKMLEGEIENTTEFSDEDFCLYTLYILCSLYTRLYDYEEGKALLDEYSEEFENKPYLGMAEIIVFEGTGDPQDLDHALEVAWEYHSDYSRYSKLRILLAKVIVSAIEQGHTYQGDKDEIPSDKEELLNKANEGASLAVAEENYPPEYDIVKARVEALLENFDAAKERITKAIGELSRKRTRYTELRSEFGRELTRITVEQQQRELSKKTSKIDSNVEDIQGDITEAESSIAEFKDDLEDTTADFRRSVLEFLGFFSAIIAAVVITGQIALNVSNVNDAVRLMMVSYGGLLFAFGGFSILLASEARSYWSRVAVMGSGLLVIGLSFCI